MSQSLQKIKPKHDYIVALALVGKGPKEISELVGMAPQSVCRILADPKIQMKLKEGQQVVVSTVIDGVSGRLLNAAETAVGRIEETLGATFPTKSSAKRHQDNVALKLLKGTGFLSEDAGNRSRPGEALTEKTVSKLTEALERSSKVISKHAEVGGTDYVDADYSIE